MDFPIRLPPTSKILYQPNIPERTHPLQKLKLGAFGVSGKFCKTEEFRESLPTSSFKHGDNLQRNNMKVTLESGSSFQVLGKIDPLQPSINVVIEFLYDLYKSGVQYSGIGTARSALSGFLSLCS